MVAAAVVAAAAVAGAAVVAAAVAGAGPVAVSWSGVSDLQRCNRRCQVCASYMLRCSLLM